MATRDKWSTNKRIKPNSPNTTGAGTASAKATGFSNTSKMNSALKSFVARNRQSTIAPAPRGAKPKTKPSTWSIHSFRRKPGI